MLFHLACNTASRHVGVAGFQSAGAMRMSHRKVFAIWEAIDPHARFGVIVLSDTLSKILYNSLLPVLTRAF